MSSDNLHRDDDVDFDFGEASPPQGDIVLMIAKAVGFLVAVAALLVLFLFMSGFRAFLGYVLYRVGLFPFMVCIGAVVYFTVKSGRLPLRTVRILYTRSCH